MKQSKLISIMLSVALLGTMLNFPVLAEEQSADDGVTVIYDQNFDACDWWENGAEPVNEEFEKKAFYSYLNQSDYMGYRHTLENGARGRGENDKSLHINATFKLPFGQNGSGGAAPNQTEDGFWVCNWGNPQTGNNGVSHKMMSNSQKMTDDEQYLHISFSALQNLLPSAGDGSGMHGAGLQVQVNFLTDEGNVNDERLLYNGGNQYLFCMEKAHYKMQMADKWITYDYVFDTKAMTVDIYVNGYPAVKGQDVSDRFSGGRKIKGLSRMDFQVRDMKTGTEPRDIHVYVDDIKVTYDRYAPVVSTYSACGDAAKITNAPEQYFDSDTGIVYNYGQSLNDMKSYIQGGASEKDVYLAVETLGSGEWASYELASTLDSRTLNDGRVVNPILCVTDNNFFYSYEVRQPLSTSISPAIAAVENEITLSWDGQSNDCQGIEIFRNGVKLAALEGNALSYTDTEVTPGVAYEYTIRELLPDKNVSVFTEALGNINKPENFAVVQVPNRMAVKLTWDAPGVGGATGYEIYRNGVSLTTVAAGENEYTDTSVKKDNEYRYSIAAVYGEVKSSLTPEIPVFVSFGSSDSRVIYSENFNHRNWWNGEETPSQAEFERKPFFAYLDADNGRNMTTSYKLENGTNGRASDDKSLHLNATFKLPFGKQADGETDIPDSAEDGTWMGTWTGDPGTNGVSHRMVSNSQKMEDDERYLHVSFSAAQKPMPPESVLGENGAGLDVSFRFLTNSGSSEKEMLHWYGRRQGVFSTFYEVRTAAGRWVNYDYVFDTADKTMDIYINGYPVVAEKDFSKENLSIKGLSKLNFQVRDINTGADERSIDAYVDDVKVAYCKEDPQISPYFSFGDAAYIDAPEKYINNDAGTIYNYGQTLAEMKTYIPGKTVYLVKEKAESTATWQSLEEYSSNSLDAVTLDDGRTVSPILYVEDGSFTYCYKIKQTVATSINLVISDVAQDSITLSWTGKSDTCKAIEIFRDGVKIATLGESAQSYTDTDVVTGQRYEYCIREIVADGNATKFSETRSGFISSVGRPENFAAVLNTNQLAVKLTWKAPRYGTVTGYEIYRDGALLTTVSADGCEYTDGSALTVGRTYRYCVAALGEGTAKSDKTPEIQIVADIISPPQNVKAENDDGNVKISWDSVAGAKGYEVYRNGVRVAQTTDCSYVLSDCADDSFYEFFVKSVNEAGQASRASETASYIKHGTKFDVFCDVFGDTLGDGFGYTTTNGAVIESGSEYGVIGTSGLRVGFNSQHFDGQTAGFSVRNELDFSKIKNSAAEIRFMIYVPEGLDTSKLRFGVAQNYKSSLAGGTVRLQATVSIDQYVKNSGWNFVRIPLKDLPEKGAYTATSANLPYETKFDYSKVAELGFFSSLEGIADTIYFMVDEIAIYANEAPRVTSVKAGGKEIANGDVISGQTDRFAVEFDTELDDGQLSSNEMKVVRGNKKVPSVVEYDEKTGEYAICLLDNLEANQAYSVVIQNTVSKGGTIQNQKYTVSFTTDATVTTEPMTKTVEMNLQSMSGTTGAPMVQRLDFTGGAANEAVCGFDIEILYDSDKLFLNKDEVTLASGLKNSGIVVENANGKLKISRAADKSKTMSLQDGIGTFGIRALESGSAQISASGTLYCYYSDTDAVKEFAVNGSTAISAVKGSGGSGSSGGIGNGGKGSSSIGGARPSVGGGDAVIPPSVRTPFSDISSVEWAREGILYLSENNIINGYEDNTFRPNRAITREEFVAIIVRAFALEDETASSNFADVNPSDWYYSYVSSAVNAGIIKGIADDTFGAGETISRQDMCTIMSRMIESQDITIDKKYSKLEFSDDNDIADYAKQAVSELQQMGIINGIGDNLFAPGGEVTRAMAAKAVYQMIQERNR